MSEPTEPIVFQTCATLSGHWRRRSGHADIKARVRYVHHVPKDDAAEPVLVLRGGSARRVRRSPEHPASGVSERHSAQLTDTIVFPGESSDGTLTEGQWNRWTQGTFRAAKLAPGLPTARAYELRHSFVSLLIHEGQSIKPARSRS